MKKHFHDSPPDSPGKEPESKAPDGKDKPPPSSFAQALGERAFANRDFFTSKVGSLGFRNALKVLIAVVPTAISFAATRHAFHSYNSVKHADTAFHRVAGPAMRNTLFQHYAFIFGGFTAFRAFCKIWQRNYDRIFANAEDASTATAAISNLPANIARDFREIMPSEIAGTAVAAFPLAAVKMGFKHDEPSLEGNIAQAKKGFVNDWLASVPAYTVFFEANDRIYDDLTRGKDSPQHYAKLSGRATETTEDGVLHANNGGNGHHGKFDFFTRDEPGRIAFRRVGSLLLGIAPFIGLQRLSRATVGTVKPGEHSFMKNVMKEYSGYAGFATYTLTAELYNEAYDALFKKLENHYSQQPHL